MKKIVASVAAISMFAAAAYAGSLVEPEMEPMVEVMEEDTGSSAGLVIPLLALLAIGVLVANSDDSTSASS